MRIDVYVPADVRIDRVKYFERRWPNAELINGFQFMRLVDVGGEVFVTYDATKTDRARFRNELLTFDGEKICTAEVYLAGT